MMMYQFKLYLFSWLKVSIDVCILEFVQYITDMLI